MPCLPVLLLVASTTLSCTDPAAGDSGRGGTTADHGISFGQAAIPTTGIVTWQVSDSVTNAWVTFGVEGDTVWTAPATITDGRARAILVGMRPGLDHTVTAYEAQQGGDVAVDSIVAAAGYAPTSLPGSAVEVDEPGRNQLFLVSSILSTPSSAVIMNSYGEWVWWHETIFKDQVIIRARVAWDGSGIHYISTPSLSKSEIATDTWLVKVDWTGEQVESVPLERAHHDFVELDDGTVAYLSADPQTFNGSAYVGDRLVELSPDGRSSQIWSVWDDFNVVDDHPDGDAGTSWAHANALDYDAATGIYYVSLRNFDAIVGISRDNGKKVWQFGGDKSDYKPLKSNAFSWEHQFEFQPDGNLLVFDNGDTTRMYSRAVEYSFDQEQDSANVAWMYALHPPVLVYGPGDVYRRDNGNTIIVWGTVGRIQEVQADGTVVWDQFLSVGGALGFATWVEDLNAL